MFYSISISTIQIIYLLFTKFMIYPTNERLINWLTHSVLWQRLLATQRLLDSHYTQKNFHAVLYRCRSTPVIRGTGQNYSSCCRRTGYFLFPRIPCRGHFLIPRIPCTGHFLCSQNSVHMLLDVLPELNEKLTHCNPIILHTAYSS